MEAKLARTVSVLLFLSVLHKCKGRGGVAVAGQSLIQLSHGKLSNKPGEIIRIVQRCPRVIYGCK